MKNSTILAAATAALAVAAIADDLYVNDFATRTSKEPIPATGVWQTATPYPTKGGDVWLACRPSGAASAIDFTSLATYFDESTTGGYGRPVLDGWFIPWITDYKLVPRIYGGTTTGSAAQNRVFTWSYGSDKQQYGTIINQIHNEFTNGQLRIQVDMKAPVEWAQSYCRFFVFPVYRKYMDILAWNGRISQNIADVTPGRFGLRNIANTTDSLLKSFPIYSNSSSRDGTRLVDGNNANTSNFAGNFADDGSNGKTNYWFRYIVTYDLDNSMFGGELYRFSKAKGHPAFDTTPSDVTPYSTFSGIAARTGVTAATGGIAGLAISAYGSFASIALTSEGNKVFADNIRMSWKAPGASDFEVFYENDFTTRRYRTLCAPARTATGAYAQTTESGNIVDTFSDYATGTDSAIVPLRTSSTDSNPIGIDGWRRLPHSYSNGRPAVFAYGGNSTNDVGGTGGKMLSFGYQDGFARLAQTLGSSFFTGTVRISADVYLPEGDRLASQDFVRRIGIGLGSAALYYSDKAGLLSTLVGGFGYERLNASGASSHRPYIIEAGGSNGEPKRSFYDTYTPPESNFWYRIEVSANLETRKYSASVIPIGATSITADTDVTAQPIFSADSLDFPADVSDIGSFYIQGYGWASANENYRKTNRVCWDNIRVYHDTDLVYENDFTTRTRTLTGATRETGDLAALQYNLDGGQDHWVRRDYTGPAGFDARAWVRDEGGNQFLALGRSSEAGRTITLVNGLGLSQTKPFRFEADIRPPSQWSAASGSATISLGDSQMLQTEAPESVYGAHRLVTFGFSGTNTSNQTQCPYYFAGCKAQVGGTELDAEIDTTHWYRFRLEVNPEAGTYDAKVIDMGTAHPTAETKGGTVVGTVSDVAFANSLAAGEGVSTILIEGKNVSGAYGSLGVDPAHILIDNLRLTVPSPFVLSVR